MSSAIDEIKSCKECPIFFSSYLRCICVLTVTRSPPTTQQPLCRTRSCLFLLRRYPRAAPIAKAVQRTGTAITVCCIHVKCPAFSESQIISQGITYLGEVVPFPSETKFMLEHQTAPAWRGARRCGAGCSGPWATGRTLFRAEIRLVGGYLKPKYNFGLVSASSLPTQEQTACVAPLAMKQIALAPSETGGRTRAGRAFAHHAGARAVPHLESESFQSTRARRAVAHTRALILFRPPPPGLHSIRVTRVHQARPQPPPLLVTQQPSRRGIRGPAAM